MTQADLGPDILLGGLSIRPSALELESFRGRERLEPRVMEVLLVLLGADGAVVTRDTLVENCWGGRAVSEDAILRVISRIRRVVESVGQDDLQLETIPKRGYRLVRKEGAPVRRARKLPRRAVAIVSIAAVVAAAVALWVFARRSPEPTAVTPQMQSSAADQVALDLEARGRAAVFEGTPEQLLRGIDYLREATVRAPTNAHNWGALAMAQALALRVVPSSERPVMAARIREAATRALSLNPREGLALAARVSLEPTFMNWSNKDRMLREAMATAPANTPAVLMQRAQFLAAVGRTREALALSERASKGAPLLPWIQARRAQLLMDLSHPDEAERVLRGAEGLWPRDAGLLQMRLMFEVANGRARNLATMADRIANSDEKEFVRSLAAAGGSPASAAAITQAFYARFRRSGGDVLKGEQAFRAASALDERDAAFDVLEAVLSARALANEPTDVVAPLRPAEFDTSALFSTDAAAARRDPRFHSVIQRLGLPAFWRRTVMPDFCKERAASHAGSLC